MERLKSPLSFTSNRVSSMFNGYNGASHLNLFDEDLGYRFRISQSTVLR